MKKNEIIEVQGVKIYPGMIPSLMILQKHSADEALAAFDELRTFIENVSEGSDSRLDFMHYMRLIREMERFVRIMAGRPPRLDIKYIVDNTDSD